MASIVKRLFWKLIPEECDRHANLITIYRTTGNRYHVNFRNLQIRLTGEEFQEWKKAFTIAKEKLGDRMADDGVWPPWTGTKVKPKAATTKAPPNRRGVRLP